MGGRSDGFDQSCIGDDERSEERDCELQSGSGFLYDRNGSIGASGDGGRIELCVAEDIELDAGILAYHLDFDTPGRRYGNAVRIFFVE